MFKEKIDDYDFGGDLTNTYITECKCGEKYTWSGQDNSNSEYLAPFYLKCKKCGESIKFKIGVN